MVIWYGKKTFYKANITIRMLMKMGKLTITLEDALEKRFRDTIGRVKGYHRGSLSEALTEAINDWIAKKEPNKKDTIT